MSPNPNEIPKTELTEQQKEILRQIPVMTQCFRCGAVVSITDSKCPVCGRLFLRRDA